MTAYIFNTKNESLLAINVVHRKYKLLRQVISRSNYQAIIHGSEPVANWTPEVTLRVGDSLLLTNDNSYGIAVVCTRETITIPEVSDNE